METTLIMVGESLKINIPFLEYIDSHIHQHVKIPKQKIFLDKSTKNLFEILEKILEQSEQTLIVSSKDSFNLVGKVISTLNEDVLELQGNTLVPSKFEKYSNNSYLINYKDKKVNVIRAKENEELPQIFLTHKSGSTFFSLIGLDNDGAKVLLQPIADTYEVKLTSTSIAEGWSFTEATACKYGNLKKFLISVKSLFPNKYIANDNILNHIVDSLAIANKTVSLAESCTGGRIATMLTSVSGSSKTFNGSVVSYSNDIKKEWLGVSSSTLKNHGAVSEACIKEMLKGILNKSSSDFAIATSGIAGPNGGTKSKQVGTVFVGACAKNGEIMIERVLLKGSRKYIQMQSSYHALRLFLHVGKDIFFK
ncbi:MAG: CinA family protein [Sulfurospirillum sp.]|nr:CinA family protein [Sulfurospirillum sp.]